MAAPRKIAPRFQPGVVKREGPLEAQGRYVDSQWVRSVRGMPEKIKGWVRYTTNVFNGIARGAHTWNDLTANTQMAFGTNTKLYYVDEALEVQNITPYDPAAGVALVDVLSTSTGSPTVTVNDVAHGRSVGWGLSLSATVGGLTLSGDYSVTSVIDADNFTITASGNAASNVVNGGGAITIYYEISPGPADPSGGFGWGTDVYGIDTYGTPRSTSNVVYEPRYWALDNFGKYLLAAPFGGPLYIFDPTVSIAHATLAASVQGPGAMRHMFVTPERFVVAVGASADTTAVMDNMLVRWSSQNTYDTWTPGLTTTANSRRLQVGKKLIAGTATGSQLNLLWSDTALYLMQYTGSSLVFDTRVAGVNCGLIGPMAFCLAGPVAYWMSQGAFWRYSGTVDRVPNSEAIAEWVFAQTRLFYGVKTVAFYNERFNEVWFLFVPDGQSEPTTYAMFGMDDNAWWTGSLTRTTFTIVDGGDGRPLLAGTDGYFYQHETGLDDHNGAAVRAYIQTAPTELDEGNPNIEISGYMGDWGRQSGNVTVTFTAYDQSGQAAIDTQSVTCTPGTTLNDVRVAGRLISIMHDSNAVGGDFRLGRFRVEVRQAGTRR